MAIDAIMRIWFQIRLTGSGSPHNVFEMILERSELRQQELQSGNINTFDTESDSNPDIDDIAAADERLRQAFTEIDAIADQLTSQELLQRYQQAQMQEISRRASTQREASLRAGARALVGPYDNIPLW